MVNGKSIFDQPVEKENIQTIATDQGDDYTTSCLLHHN